MCSLWRPAAERSPAGNTAICSAKRPCSGPDRGGGEDIGDAPAVGIAPEWMSEKAIAIATYCAASGAYVIMGISNPVEGSPVVTDVLSRGWEEMVGGKIEFVVEPEEMVRRALGHIDKKREALKLPAYDPERFGRSGDWRGLGVGKLSPGERAGAPSGEAAGGGRGEG